MIKPELFSLTPRDREVADLVMMGELDKHISYMLSMPDYTVKRTVRRLCRITESKNRTVLALKLWGIL